ncbi:MAG: N-acetylmuramoyl-L-alanine amidase, partial [Actinobacteria bacterium]|nr:N-acetylmuramoyl-L-alanine amidase [Actinomycetota bacterium]
MACRLSIRIVSPLAAAGLIAWLAAAPAATAGAAAGPGPLGAAFQAAAQHENVPEDLLLAVSYLRTGWNAGYQADESGLTFYGPMALSADRNGHGTLAQAAADLGLSASQLETDPAANIMGGAAVLADDAKATNGKKAATLGQWYGALADFTGVTYYEPAKEFADSVYALLGQGVTGAATDGEQLSVAAQQVSPDTSEIDVLNLTHLQPQQSDYPASTVYIPAQGTGFGGSNRPKNGLFLGYVVVHDTEEDYPGTVASFSEPHDVVSAHYVVDGQDNAPVSYPAVTQFVHNHDIAFHAGNFWFNQHSIGIENV